MELLDVENRQLVLDGERIEPTPLDSAWLPVSSIGSGRR